MTKRESPGSSALTITEPASADRGRTRFARSASRPETRSVAPRLRADKAHTVPMCGTGAGRGVLTRGSAPPIQPWMQATVNGERTELPEGLTVAGLLRHLGVRAERVAVE